MPVTIRPATIDDMAAIHALVAELADYENEPDAFVASLEEYQRDWQAGWFEALLAVDEQDEVQGMALYYDTFSTWKGRMLYLEDFVVKQGLRRQGIGQQLFDAVLEVGRQKECALVKWQVLDWNQSAIDFYKKNGAQIEQQWLNGKIFL